MHGISRVLRVSFIGFILSDIVLGKYTDYWAVQIEGGEEVARSIADKHGFVYKGQILQDYYHLQHRKVAKRSIYPSSYYHRTLAKDSKVKWLEQQLAKKRVKRDIILNDPKWPNMWYLNRGGGLDMNVMKAWEQGYTGKGVVVTILDDGIEKDHPDLQKNYDEQASYDVNGHDPDPQPRYDYSNENRHGTRCAGEVAAEADNNVCSVGVAYNAKIGGVRMLDGDVTDSVEAQSLSLQTQHIHIYSASWGPDDDGRTVDGPATLARKAFYDGITKGRGGLGSIFVWASGNGGRDGDNCNCDGYTNSIYTLSISSSTENGNVPWYSESCSSTLATTYSSGSGGEKQIVTTDLRKDCTETHTGTSASAPLAAGIIALALQANPSITWRDMQHIVVETAKPDNLKAPDWVINGVGKNVSHSFGFGLMDASAMVSMARNWTTVPDQHICEIRSLDHNSRIVPINGKIMVPLYTDGCEGTVNHVKYLEHVQARITMSSSRRGEIQISLTSPSLTRSVLLAKRTRDTSREGFNNWAFMTTHNWGEPAKGQWVLEIENGMSSSELKEWTLVVTGTEKHPLKQNVSTQAAPASRSFTCAGVTSNGICIECKPGFFKMDQHCVAHCPEHYYGSVQAVHLASPIQPNSSKPLLHTQGVCKPCHPSCLTCRGDSPSDCFQCASGYERQGDSEAVCHKTLLWDLLDPAVMKHLAWALILCIGAIIFFSLLFAILQARHRRRLCWASKHSYVPDWTKGAYNGVSTLDEPESRSMPGASSTRDRMGAAHQDPDFCSHSLFKTSSPPPTPLPPFGAEYRLNGYSKGMGYPSLDPAV
ncbi:furin-like protease kpc-1 isoform X3 [Babylonia areolata]|uniref:furin-like protease kpc-1 isoform X3 n=1 Tax=Babylonia areolata TaxID=304850 RepID=UPI003FD2DF02